MVVYLGHGGGEGVKELITGVGKEINHPLVLKESCTV